MKDLEGFEQYVHIRTSIILKDSSEGGNEYTIEDYKQVRGALDLLELYKKSNYEKNN